MLVCVARWGVTKTTLEDVARDEGGGWETWTGSAAVEWAKRCPASDNEVIEVRQVQEFSDFPADVQEAAAESARVKESQ